jgi:hypothetical protein
MLREKCTWTIPWQCAEFLLMSRGTTRSIAVKNRIGYPKRGVPFTSVAPAAANYAGRRVRLANENTVQVKVDRHVSYRYGDGILRCAEYVKPVVLQHVVSAQSCFEKKAESLLRRVCISFRL